MCVCVCVCSLEYGGRKRYVFLTFMFAGERRRETERDGERRRETE